MDAHSLGGLFMLLQIATVYAGHLYGIDPMDQPGVELGKQLTYGIMGRPGFEEARARVGSPHAQGRGVHPALSCGTKSKSKVRTA